MDTDSLSQEEYLKLVREKCNEMAKKSHDPEQIFVQNYILEKACEICKNYHDDENLLLCDFCDDGYHIYCLVNFFFIKFFFYLFNCFLKFNILF